MPLTLASTLGCACNTSGVRNEAVGAFRSLFCRGARVVVVLLRAPGFELQHTFCVPGVLMLGPWLWAALVGGLLAVPGAYKFFFFRWTPYSSLEFFVLLVPLFVALGCVKSRFRSFDAWVRCLQVVNGLY